ncbi:GMC family oxidoreductase N-terminal domain-containing protein [Janthinobacterium sp. GW460P]|uniref:GMC family oxidoreductase n=1 Tax=unclassified Janthinobacterium TaxID=2610881 RepID=UPI000A321095|nr:MULTISPECIES: GMC family oxidoreductase N-terminal domain-containing protein [unclassified Janthinobacterium]MCC7703492.1 GMC family oxidoreductase N-terminal domain-containing protein [Janthinobacterium sp. GW460P]MCC7708999.1 GMC family oxidoreductase N-terminal domain-containing protein [Janthinobacterium sp. GW460W]
MESAGEYDYIIVGGGTAGCVLANRLTRDKDANVLLVEAGGKDDYVWIHIPVGYLHCIGNPRTDWLYSTQADAGLGGRSLIYPRGKVLGGSSSINGMIYMRGQAGDYDHWADLTDDASWRWDKVLPLFKQSEDYYGGASENHGAGGEWRVEKQRLSWDILNAFRDAAQQVGIPKTSDFNGGDNSGSAYFDVNQRRGIRWNTAKAFLKPAARRPNLTIMTGCHVERLLLETTESGPRCTGIVLTGGGTQWQATARRETLLTAGAIGSPQLLQLSGIGPAALLREHGITPVLDSVGVGGNLQDHLQLRMVFKVQGVKTLNVMASNIVGKMQIGLQYALFQSGPMSMAPSQLGAFAKSDPRQATPNLQYHVQPLSLDKFGEPLHAFPAFTASVCNLRPTSRGHVHIASADSYAAPKIVPNYLSTEQDRAVAADALRLTRAIAAAPALKKFAPEEYRPGVQFQSQEELAQAASQIGTTIFHPVGTCRMGLASDAASVVDSQLRVIGVHGLRVVDASIMPYITSGNTNSPTVMIAEKAAQMIHAAWK